MAKMTDVPDVNAYSSGVKKVLILGKDGKTMITDANPLPVNANIKVDDVSINAEMKVDTGHDLYLIDNITVTGDYSISFPSIPTGLDLINIQSFENKTNGEIYITSNATVTNTSIVLDASKQSATTPKLLVGDIIEVVFRGPSRLVNGDQTSKITTNVLKQKYDVDLSATGLDYTTTFTEPVKINNISLRFTSPTAQDIKIEIVDNTDASYNVLLRDDKFTTPFESYVWQPETDLIINSGDQIKVTCTNTGTPLIFAYLTILGEKR